MLYGKYFGSYFDNNVYDVLNFPFILLLIQFVAGL